MWAANGSNEMLQQLLQAFGGPGRTALGFDPTYSMHRLITRGHRHHAGPPMPRLPGFRLEPEQAALVVREHAPDVVFLCSPNNPTGTALDLDVIEAVYAARQRPGGRRRGVRRVLRPARRRSPCCRAGPRLVVTRTMSKAFAFAAARLGYLAADPAVVEALQLVRLPYHLSVLTQAAARAALARADELLASVAAVVEQRDRLLREIAALGLEVVESDANFVLFGEFGDQAATWQGLLDRGVLVRDVGLAGWLRVTAGTEAETTAFLDALARGTEHAPRRAKRWTREQVREGRARDQGVAGPGRARARRRPAATEVDTGVPFFDHMLAQLGKHGGFDLTCAPAATSRSTPHHTVEDTAIALGQALREALGDKAGIRRFGDALVPLDETLVQAAVDLSGRPYVVHTEPEIVELIGSYDTTLTRHIWESFAAAAQVCLHVRVLAGRNAHHVVEAQFKAVARALRDAVALDARVTGVPSTKGSL